MSEATHYPIEVKNKLQEHFVKELTALLKKYNYTLSSNVEGELQALCLVRGIDLDETSKKDFSLGWEIDGTDGPKLKLN